MYIRGRITSASPNNKDEPFLFSLLLPPETCSSSVDKDCHRRGTCVAGLRADQRSRHEAGTKQGHTQTRLQGHLQGQTIRATMVGLGDTDWRRRSLGKRPCATTGQSSYTQDSLWIHHGHHGQSSSRLENPSAKLATTTNVKLDDKALQTSTPSEIVYSLSAVMPNPCRPWSHSNRLARFVRACLRQSDH